MIQCFFRSFLQFRRRLRRLKEKKFLAYKNKCAVNIQKIYRAFCGKGRVKLARIDKANRDLKKAKRMALMEVKATLIQCAFHCRMARKRVREFDLDFLCLKGSLLSGGVFQGIETTAYRTYSKRTL